MFQIGIKYKQPWIFCFAVEYFECQKELSDDGVDLQLPLINGVVGDGSGCSVDEEFSLPLLAGLVVL